MTFTTVSAESKESRVVCRVHMACFFGDSELKCLLVIGPEQSTKAIFASLNGASATIMIGNKYVSRCPYHYTRKHVPVGEKWVGMLISSKDPRCLWNDDEPSLVAALKRNTATPFIEEWEPYLRKQLKQQTMLVKLNGRNPLGSFLDCSTEQLDAIVTDGITGKHLTLKGMA